jgi:lipopolysaccharide/colanic/teichoic acid biosynthesis glycosyltransferase
MGGDGVTRGAGIYRAVGKRGLDLLLVLVSMPLWLPLIGLLALCVLATMGMPLLFRQRRPGRGGRPFTLLKLRTMTRAVDAGGALLPDQERLGRFGRFLRSASLDELPELLSVLKGDMSLVGPRPLMMQYLPRYTPEQARRHEVRPGLTGWAQVNGRNALTWEQKFAADVWYVDHVSLALDLRVLWLTATAVLTRQGINADGHATMPEFLGSAGAEEEEH